MEFIFKLLNVNDGLTVALEVIHVTAAAVWFGTQVAGAEDIERAIELGDSHTDWLLKRQERLGSISLLASLLTIFFGCWLILGQGGFGDVHPRHSIAFLLTLILLGVDARAMRPTWKHIAELVRKGEPNTTRKPLQRRYRWLQYTCRTLWVIILALMVWDPA